MEDEILEAGAETQTDTAEDQGNLVDGEQAGADTQETQTAEAEGEETDETTSQETEDGTEEQKKDKGAHQTTLKERVEQEVEKRFNERLAAEVEKQLQARKEAETLPYVALTPAEEKQLNSDYAAAYERKLELEETFKLSDDQGERQKILVELRKTDKWINETEKWYADNEVKKAEYLKSKEQVDKQAELQSENARRLEMTAEAFREAHKIPQNVWDESSKWFSAQLENNKLLQIEFQESYRLRGAVGAVEFAHKYCTENMGKEAEAAKKQKEEAKKQLAPGVTGNVKDTPAYKDYQKALDYARKNPDDDDAWERLGEAKRKAGIR